MAEIELSVLSRWLDKYIPDDRVLDTDVHAVIDERNNDHAGIDRRFTSENTRIKLKGLYSSVSK
jgi:hypothetical protein